MESFLDGKIVLHCGDMLAVLPTLAKNSIDSAVTDPPYHLTSIVKRFGADDAAPAKVGKTGAYARASSGFMGKVWDGGDIAFQVETWGASPSRAQARRAFNRILVNTHLSPHGMRN